MVYYRYTRWAAIARTSQISALGEVRLLCRSTDSLCTSGNKLGLHTTLSRPLLVDNTNANFCRAQMRWLVSVCIDYRSLVLHERLLDY